MLCPGPKVKARKSSNCIICVSLGSVYFQKFKDEKIISQIVGFIKDCDQNGDRVSKINVSCHICIRSLKSVFVRYEKYGTLFINLTLNVWGFEKVSYRHNFFISLPSHLEVFLEKNI